MQIISPMYEAQKQAKEDKRNDILVYLTIAIVAPCFVALFFYMMAKGM